MRFPKVIRHRKAEVTIYGKKKAYPFYRVAWRVNGQRRMKHFATYGEAKTEADKKVRDLAKGSQSLALTDGQSGDALAALERLESFRQSTGRRVSLLATVSEYVEAAGKLNGRTLGEAVDGYLNTVASVKRQDIGKAVEEFITADEPRTKASPGQRAQLSPKYAYNRAIMLRRFAGTFPNTSVCDLGKEHLDLFIGALNRSATKSRNRRHVVSAKSRNHHRGAVRQFLEWAVRKDYLPRTHRLFEAEAMRPERANVSEIDLYTPKEFRALLEVKSAEGPMRALIAIGGLAGLRTQELLRLDWRDVWRVSGHIEVTAGKSKNRQRRLVEIVPALAAWLEPFRAFSTGLLWTEHEISFQRSFRELCEAVGVTRKANGLRHGFCSYHFAAHGNENLTAAQAGNSPAMIHQHYKGLATKAEAEKWFKVRPSKSETNVIPLAAVSRKHG